MKCFEIKVNADGMQISHYVYAVDAAAALAKAKADFAHIKSATFGKPRA